MNNHINTTISAPGESNQPSLRACVRVVADPRLIQSVDPYRCRLWPLHPRAQGRVNKESCKDLIRSIAAHGQFTPALGRPVIDDPEMDVEILCGSRRLFAARHLKLPILVQVRHLSDREAALAAELENKIRKSISRSKRQVSFALSPNQAPPKSGTPNAQDQDTTPPASSSTLTFTARRYFNVLELVFPRSINEFTIELIKRVVSDFLDTPPTRRQHRHR
jgi:hypothetical protein